MAYDCAASLATISDSESLGWNGDPNAAAGTFGSGTIPKLATDWLL